MRRPPMTCAVGRSARPPGRGGARKRTVAAVGGSHRRRTRSPSVFGPLSGPEGPSRAGVFRASREEPRRRILQSDIEITCVHTVTGHAERSLGDSPKRRPDPVICRAKSLG